MLRQRKPAAKVTTEKLYDSLFQLDKGISERFTTLQDSINGLHERMTTHEAAHTVSEQVVSQERQIKLDARKGAIGAGVASFLLVVAGAIKTLVGW